MRVIPVGPEFELYLWVDEPTAVAGRLIQARPAPGEPRREAAVGEVWGVADAEPSDTPWVVHVLLRTDAGLDEGRPIPDRAPTPHSESDLRHLPEGLPHAVAEALATHSRCRAPLALVVYGGRMRDADILGAAGEWQSGSPPHGA